MANTPDVIATTYATLIHLWYLTKRYTIFVIQRTCHAHSLMSSVPWFHPVRHTKAMLAVATLPRGLLSWRSLLTLDVEFFNDHLINRTEIGHFNNKKKRERLQNRNQNLQSKLHFNFSGINWLLGWWQTKAYISSPVAYNRWSLSLYDVSASRLRNLNAFEIAISNS